MLPPDYRATAPTANAQSRLPAGENPDVWRNRKDFVVFVGYGLFAALIRDHVISRPRVLAAIRS
jgi:hypothetical protein